jgi:myo-inositol-1-phosphate synthase
MKSEPPVIKVALFGAGNSAKAFAESLKRYGGGGREGLWHEKVGGHGVEELSVSLAYDVDGDKVGKDFYGRKVRPGLLLDEPPRRLTQGDFVCQGEKELMGQLKKANVDVALNLISSGQDRSSRKYAELCGRLGIAFVNATPALVANDRRIAALFRRSRAPLVGDDLLSQMGGTMLHKGILDFLQERGIRVVKSYQLDVGGSPDTLNTLQDEIRAFKRGIKSESIAEELPYKVDTVAGTTDFVEFMGSKRTVYLWIMGKGPLDEPYVMDVFFKSSDPVNAANILLDSARAAFAAKGRGGVEEVISAFGFKNPPKAARVRKAMEDFERAYLR